MKIGAIERSKLAKNGQEFRDLHASNTDGIIRSADDVRQLYEAKHGPFAKISGDDFNAFLSSLKFDSAGGVITGSYKPLMSSLTITDIHEVFENFGMSREYFTDSALEYACVNGTCEFDFWSFCSSLCVPQTEPT
jgi:hypothetical protein